MKSSEIGLVLALATLSISLLLTGCEINSTSVPAPADDSVSIETTTDDTVADTIEDDLANEGIELEDESSIDQIVVDTSIAGTYYLTEDQNLYTEGSYDSELVSVMLKGSVVIVSCLYGDTGFVQIVNSEGEILGYIDSNYIDTVNPLAEETTETTTDDQTSTGTTDYSNGAVSVEQLTPEELAEIIAEATSGSGSNTSSAMDEYAGSIDASGATNDDSSGAEIGEGTVTVN